MQAAWSGHRALVRNPRSQWSLALYSLKCANGAYPYFGRLGDTRDVLYQNIHYVEGKVFVGTTISSRK